MMSWRLYESCITEHFRLLYPEAVIEHNVKMPGIFSKVDRQIDVLIAQSIAGFQTRIVIECKYFANKIDIGIVEQFIAFLADVRASKGVIITNVGFSQAAVRRAHNEGRDIEVAILDFEDLDSFSGIGGAVMHKNGWGVIMPCPSGWIMHPEPQDQCLCVYTRPAIEVTEALQTRELMYPEISLRSEFGSFDDLFKFHARNTKSRFPEARFDYDLSPRQPFGNSDERPLAIRRVDYKEYPEPEITVFVQFHHFYLFIVLLAPEKDLERNLKKLAFMTKMALPIKTAEQK